LTGPPTAKDFFPTLQGEKKEYQFFRSPGQEVGRKNRVVECLEAQGAPDGSVKSSFKTIVFAGGAYGDEIAVDSYSASGNVLAHTAHNDQPLVNRFLFKIPKPGGVERWLHQEKDGTVKYYKASFSPLKTNERIYPDCLWVVEKTVMKAGGMTLRYFYYARGMGLIRLEVYGPDLKIDRSASIDLVEAVPAPSGGPTPGP
jgi:hypothetical protein